MSLGADSVDRTTLDRLLSRDPWRNLPGDAYRNEELYARELERIWRRCWVFVGVAGEWSQPGDYVSLTVGDVPIVVVRDEGGLRAFHNVCSHRGTLLCEEPHGRVGKSIVCPYHQWTFGRDGSLLSCRDMPEVDRSMLGLRPVSVRTAAGLVFVCLADSPPDFAPFESTFGAAMPHGLDRAKVAKAIDYSVEANWKIVWENNRECYHCDVGHPQYVRSNFDSAEGERDTPAARAARERVLAGAEDYWSAEGLSVKHAAGGLARFPDPDDPNPFPVSATRTVMVEGYDSESMDGRRVAPFLGSVTSPAVGVLRLRSVPSFWCHISCDHAALTRVVPAGRGRTAIRVSWLVAAEAREGVDYELDRLLPFWQMTSEQDWALCERVARGVASPYFRPGPISREREYNVDAFFRWYDRRLRGPGD